MEESLLNKRKETILALMNDPMYSPMRIKELAVFLDIPKSKRDELTEVLESLLSEGKIRVSQKGKYGKPETRILVGIYTGHIKGFGFVTVEGMDQDIFIPAEHANSALNGDRVQITTEAQRSGKRVEGHVVKVLERANGTIIGYYQKNKNFGFVIPDNQRVCKDIFIPQGKDMGAVQGHKVVVHVTNFGDSSHNPEGVITEILGHVNDPGTDILSIVRAYGLPEEFPDDVMSQTEKIPAETDTNDMAGRLDLRALQTVTIDGEDAKDLDDAISISKKDGKYTLSVHIADVTNYVTEGSPLDKEALKRGTSVYLVDRVIPMLPHKLSNGICSLNAGTDRLALSCIMDIDSDGRILGHRIAETVINVDRRMTYTAVEQIVTKHDEEMIKEYSEFVPMFELMKELADILRAHRKQRGSIDFDFPESKIILDEKGKPIDIKPYERNAATKIIEDFMLMANETVAEDFFWQEIPFIYRTHDNPDPEKMKSLATFINNFGFAIHMQQGEVYPKELQKLLVNIEDSPQEALISRLTLRSMKQAKYTVENTGHFGLAAKYYTHFTSPIRRYPDLQIHRIIKENLRGKLSEKRIAHYYRILPEVATSSSALERRADEAERETDKLKQCEYMARFIGKEFDGVISGITNWGIYVELPNTVEGMIRLTELHDDYYRFDEQHYELFGETTGKTYKLGQNIRIQVSGTDKMLKTIDFIPANDFATGE